MLRRLLSIAALALAVALPATAQVTVDANKTGSSAPFAGTFTWTGKPTCDTGLTGATARISDVGVAPGLRIVCDGTAWRADGVQVLSRVGTIASVTGTATETTVATVTVPAGLMGTSGSLRITTLWTNTSSANNKTVRVKFGGTAILGAILTTNVSTQFMTIVRNRAASNSQVATNTSSSGTGGSSSGVTTLAVDSSADVTVLTTGQLATSTETVSLEAQTIEIIP